MKTQRIDEVDFLATPERRNGISIDLVSHDAVYQSLVNTPVKPIIINDYINEFSENRASEAINNLIRTHYGTDELDTAPKCDCGYVSGGYNEGVVCSICHTKVERIVDKPLVSQIWLRPPKGVPAFISPMFWNLFCKVFDTTKFSLLEWLTSRAYVPGGRGDLNTSKDAKVLAVTTALERAGIERGMDFFYNNFDFIMNEILQPKPYLNHCSKSSQNNKNEAPENHSSKDKVCRQLRLIVKHYRNCIFSHFLPFPSKLIMVSEEGSSVSYIDKNMPAAFDALKTIIQLERSAMPLREQTVETKTMRANKAFAEYYKNFRKTTYGKKAGIARRQQGSTRSPMSGRAVIAPIATSHRYDELHTPWAWTISLCRTMIANKLLKMYFTPQQLFLFIDKCIVNCTGSDGDLMEAIFDALIDESPSKGIEVSMLRNPTLVRLSNQLFRIVKIIRDTNINAIMMSVLTIKGPNADFDGDQLQVKLLVDAVERDQFSRLGSHLGLMGTDTPFNVNGVITLHPECISMANNFLEKYRIENPNDVKFVPETI